MLLRKPAALTTLPPMKVVRFPPGLVEIGREAFSNDWSIHAVVFPEKLKKIGAGAFHDCDSLFFVRIPGTVSIIEDGAFADCSHLVLVVEDRTAGYYHAVQNGLDYVFFNTARKNEENYAYKIERGTAVITRYRGEDKAVMVPSRLGGARVTRIDERAFQGKDQMRTVMLPPTLRRVDGAAFGGCTSLMCVGVTNKDTSIATNAFIDTNDTMMIMKYPGAGWSGEDREDV